MKGNGMVPREYNYIDDSLLSFGAFVAIILLSFYWPCHLSLLIDPSGTLFFLRPVLLSGTRPSPSIWIQTRIIVKFNLFFPIGQMYAVVARDQLPPYSLDVYCKFPSICCLCAEDLHSPTKLPKMLFQPKLFPDFQVESWHNRWSHV